MEESRAQEPKVVKYIKKKDHNIKNQIKPQTTDPATEIKQEETKEAVPKKNRETTSSLFNLMTDGEKLDPEEPSDPKKKKT